MYSGHASVSVCLSVRGRMPMHYCTGPDVAWGMPPGYALLGGFAIGAHVVLLWQHSANAKCQRVLVLAVCLVLDCYGFAYQYTGAVVCQVRLVSEMSCFVSSGALTLLEVKRHICP